MKNARQSELTRSGQYVIITAGRDDASDMASSLCNKGKPVTGRQPVAVDGGFAFLLVLVTNAAAEFDRN